MFGFFAEVIKLSFMQWILLRLIRFYQLTLSSVMGRKCRYLPTCSEYASDAITKHGSGRGSLMAFARVCRCHPWGGHGFDPVPDEYRGPVWRQNKKAGT
jgi:uncharacterized protein